jgi:two-component system, cell cycle response regulator
VLMNTDRFTEAATLLDRYVKHEHLVDDARAMVDWNLLCARAHRRLGRVGEALDRVDRAMDLAERSGDHIVMTLAVRERSRIREAMGDLEGALADLRAADDGSRLLRSGRFEALVEQLMRRAQLEASRRRLEREAEHFVAERRRLTLASETDPLTGVGNRRRLAAAMEAIAVGPDRFVSVIMLDIDRFKDANDALGHAFGDRILVDLAFTLNAIARERDVLCRPGGDEFVILLPGVDSADVSAVADRIRSRVSALRWTSPDDGRQLGVSCSLGVASGPSHEVAELVDTADDGLLLAKRNGRDRIVPGRLLGDRPGTPASGVLRPPVALR